MSEHVRRIEHKDRKDDQEDDNREPVFDGVIWVKRNGVFLDVLNFNTGRVVIARDVQRPDVQDHNTSNHEGQQIVQREETLQRLITN
mmetsp:Transcript_10080/g.13153  ORF Transcript_10080/g.13153 Transcript_10080/m.13153 type:complete len:87 (-) Transcript_10080:626-886(-)